MAPTTRRGCLILGLCVTPKGRSGLASSAEDFQELTVWDKTEAREKAFYNIRISSGLGRLSPDSSEMLAGYRDLSDAPGMTAYKTDWAKSAVWAPSWHLEMPESEMQHPTPSRHDCAVYAANDPIRAKHYLGIQTVSSKPTTGKTCLRGRRFFDLVFRLGNEAKSWLHLCGRIDAGKTADGPL